MKRSSSPMVDVRLMLARVVAGSATEDDFAALAKAAAEGDPVAEHFEERAAIGEFLGGLSRADAEVAAARAARLGK